jgi:hypothetical protein
MKRLPYYLVIGSLIPYLLIFTLPFFHFSGGIKIAITAALALIGEAMFWIGGILVGKEAMNKYREKMNPFRWFKNKEVKDELD